MSRKEQALCNLVARSIAGANWASKKVEGSMNKKGRPPKNGVKEPEHFLRALKITHSYSKARAGGQKQSAAVREAVDYVRQRDPEMPVSETTVKRVLAEFLAQDSRDALKVEYLIREGEEAAERRSFLMQNSELGGTKSPAVPADQDLRRPLKSFKFGFAKRPRYPRHNGKSSKS
jgi:hypothetical protein